MSNPRPIENAKFSGTLLASDVTNKSAVREALGLQERYGVTPLVHRRLEAGSNVRVLVFGDSIASGMLYGDFYGVLRQMQASLGNAGAGGVGVNTEQIQYFDGSTAYATANWFREYVQVPSGSSYEFARSSPTRGRRYANEARVMWRAPVSGTAQFVIETCNDADGAGSGTWTTHGGTRTATAAGGSEEVGSATVSLTADRYRLRVRATSGTVDVFGMELSHSSMGGVVIHSHVYSGSAFSTWASLSATQREGFMEAVDPDVILLVYKDSAATMTTALAALLTTLGTSLSGSYPRDVVLLAPFPSLPVGDEAWDLMDAQRDFMRYWANVNRQTFIDLFDLGPSATIYLADDVHLSGASEEAHMAHMILDRLGWLRYSKVMALAQPVIRQARRTAFLELADSTTFAEDTVFRVPLAAGTWRVTGRWHFTNDGSAGEGGKVRIGHTGTATMADVDYEKWANNGNPTVYQSPYFGGLAAWPLELAGQTASDISYGYTLKNMTLTVTEPGFLTVSAAKDATGGTVYLREGSFIRAELLA